MRFGFVLLWTVVGLAVIAIATALVGGWTDPSFWSSVLVNLGTTVFLAGFLVWLERRFVAATRTVARETATTAASEAATSAAAEVTQVLSERIDGIQARFERYQSEQADQEDAAVSAFGEAVSYESVVEALETAVELGAVSHSLFVSAGNSADAPIIRIDLVREDGHGYDDEELSVVGIEFTVDTYSATGVGYSVSAEWHRDGDLVPVLAALRTQMIRVGYGRQSQLLRSDQLFENLRVGLSDAVSGRRAAPGAWRAIGQLIDIVTPDWVVSDSGLENRQHGVVIERRSFPDGFGDDDTFQPAVPEWTDAATWSWVVARARRRLRGGTSIW